MQLTIDNLTKEFTTDAGEHIVALSDINLEIRDSEFICLLGPSGCGKTTLLRIIGGLDQPSSGQVILDNQVITRPNPRMAMIFQEYSLYPWRNVLDNTAFGLELNGMSREERYAVAKRYLDLVGLTEFSQSFPYELSGGMRQRVAVVRALAVEPAVLLMDEPFGALDAQTRNKLQHDLVDIWEKTKKTILFVTHSVDEAVFLADRIVVLSPRPGRICENIPIEQPRPRDRTSVEFAQVRRHVLDLISLK
ncbi:MAG: ABC transporter ATP-binding protein [Methanoregula sp.]|nr:ABC transporter ATP-binding protein [Methanoregula sp.]MDD5024017.1 ABC transporter ATP-binding protein [Methanoregula sp.]MDD5186727.1 ABC transporter ATP-binding protein [Methanoregula sp.]